jgi:hypothetical protein
MADGDGRHTDCMDYSQQAGPTQGDSGRYSMPGTISTQAHGEWGDPAIYQASAGGSLLHSLAHQSQQQQQQQGMHNQQQQGMQQQRGMHNQQQQGLCFPQQQGLYFPQQQGLYFPQQQSLLFPEQSQYLPEQSMHWQPQPLDSGMNAGMNAGMGAGMGASGSAAGTRPPLATQPNKKKKPAGDLYVGSMGREGSERPKRQRASSERPEPKPICLNPSCPPPPSTGAGSGLRAPSPGQSIGRALAV